MDTSNLIDVEDNASEQIDSKKQFKSTCRQFAALLPGYLLMIVGGLHIGWDIFNPKLKLERAALSADVPSFYFGALFVGVASGHRWYRHHSKALTYYVSAIYCTVSGIMLIRPMTENPRIFRIAQILAGVAVGQAYYALIMQCIILKINCRGILLSFCHFFKFIGIYTAVIIAHIRQDIFSNGSHNKIQNIGVIVCVLSIVVVICTYKILKEFPPHLLYTADYDGIMARLLQLRNEINVTAEIQTEFNEFKHILEEDGRLNSRYLYEGNIKPIFILIMVTTVSVLSFNCPLNIIRLNGLAPIENKLFIFIGILIIVRIAFGIIACNLCEKLGRKKIQFISGCASGVILLVHGLISSIDIYMTPAVSIIIFVAYEISITLGVNSITSVLMFEAFPLTKRSESIRIIMLFEYYTQLLLVAAVYYYMTPNMYKYILFGFGGLIILLSVFLWFKLPETKGLTMRQARDRFRS